MSAMMDAMMKAGRLKRAFSKRQTTAPCVVMAGCMPIALLLGHGLTVAGIGRNVFRRYRWRAHHRRCGQGGNEQ